jgi:hypothetical protein
MVLAVPTAGAIKVVLLRFWPEFFTSESATTHAAAATGSSSDLAPKGCPRDAD